MQENYAYKPFQFFVVTLLVTWVTWFAAAYFSYQPGTEVYQVLLMLPGLFAPCVVAIALIARSGNKDMKKDFWDRLLNLKRIKWSYLPLTLLLMPAVVSVSILVSVLFGKSINQLKLSDQFSFSAGFVPVLLILMLAPTVEELGWRGYGVDSLNSKYSLFTTTCLFALLWALWHVPLYFINHYYQNELWQTNIIYAINFMVSVWPAAVLMNWLYYRNNRSIAICILFHLTLDAASEGFQAEQFTKCIVTGVLLIVALIVILKEKELFFGQRQTSPAPALKSLPQN